MSELKLHIQSNDDDTDFSDSDFLDEDDLGLDIDFEGHDVPYITSPVFPDMPKLKEGSTPWKVNANGVQICEVAVGNDFDFAETKEMGVQVSCRISRENSADLKEADDYMCFNVRDINSNENKLCQEGNGTKESNEEQDERFSNTRTVDTDNDLIQQVYVGNVDTHSSLASHGSQKKINSLGISDDSENSLSETDIEYDEDSSEDEFWPQRETESRRLIGVSPAKFRLLRKWFYDYVPAK